MDVVQKILVVLHLVGMAMLVGGWLLSMRDPKVSPGMWHGALTQLVTGLLLVGVAESQDWAVNHAKIGVKLLVAVVVAVLVFLARRKKDTTAGTLHAIGGLALVNVLVAVLWT